MHARGPHSDPDLPVPIRVSRREARAARKKLQKLRGRAWTDIPAAERLSLRATAEARESVASQIGVGLILALILASAGAAVFYGCLELGPAVRAAAGHGTRGFFIARNESCDRVGCTWDGTFESANRQVLLRHVAYADADRAMHAGSIVPAVFSGGHDDVYAVQGSAGWIKPAVLLVLGAAVIVAWLWLGPARYVRRRLRNRQNLRDMRYG